MFKRNLASTRRRKAGREKKLVPAKSFNSGKLGQEKGTGSGKWIEDPLQLRFRLPRANAAASKAGAPLKILPAGEKGLRLLSLPRDRALSRGESRFIDLSREKRPRTTFRYCLPRESTLSRIRIKKRKEKVISKAGWKEREESLHFPSLRVA